MNCYYSNLIEGHDTRPVDIERALHADFATEPKRRDLQLEAAAHIAVQAAIDTDAIDATQPLSALARDIHRQFYERLPDSLRWAEELGTGRRVAVVPGAWREGDVTVGLHVAPPPAELPSWMARFDECAPERFGRAERLVAIAAAHHRLLWIPPFADGNGRVARLLSTRRCAALGWDRPSGRWRVALARNVAAYRAYLARAGDHHKACWTGGAFCRTEGWRISAGSSWPPVSTRYASCAPFSRPRHWPGGCASSLPPRRPAAGWIVACSRCSNRRRCSAWAAR